MLPPPKHDAQERALDRLEPAWADFANGLRTGLRRRRDSDANQTILPPSLHQLRLQFDAHRQQFENGGALALLHALRLALEQNVPLPYWLAREVRERIGKFTSLQDDAPTLDEAFGVARVIPAAGKRRDKLKADIALRVRLWVEVSPLLNTMALDPAVRLVIQRDKLHVGVTKAKAMFEHQDRIQRLHFGQRPRARR